MDCPGPRRLGSYESRTRIYMTRAPGRFSELSWACLREFQFSPVYLLSVGLKCAGGAVGLGPPGAADLESGSLLQNQVMGNLEGCPLPLISPAPSPRDIVLLWGVGGQGSPPHKASVEDPAGRVGRNAPAMAGTQSRCPGPSLRRAELPN